MNYKIKDACDVIIINTKTNESFNLGTINQIDIKKEKSTHKYDSKIMQIGEFTFKPSNPNTIDKIIELATCEILYDSKIEDNNFRIKIGNIPLKYMSSNENGIVISEIVHEYCCHIVRQLYNDGYEFNDDVIDFQKYLI